MEDDMSIIRMIRVDELDQLLELYKHLHTEDDDVGGNETNAIWREIVDDPNLHYFVSELDGKLVSSCTLAIIKNLTRGDSMKKQGFKRA